jgi:hypothetical protein
MSAQRRPRLEAATLRLRGRRGPLACRVFWPSLGRVRRPVVAFDTDSRAYNLCQSTGRVVLTITSDAALSSDDVWNILCWAGDHAAELGARADAVLLDCRGVSAELVGTLQKRADAEGWPQLGTLSSAETGARPVVDKVVQQ